MGLIYLAIFLAAIGFVIVAAFLSLVLYRLSQTMKVVGSSLEEAEKTVSDMTPRLRNSLKETDMLVDDIQVKLEATDSVFDTFGHMGGSVHNLAGAFNKRSDQMTEEELNQAMTPFINAMKWTEAALQMYKKTK
jgi:uncharacterized protein YoxC